MSKIKMHTQIIEKDFTLLNFTLETNIEPKDLLLLNFKDIEKSKGVVINGRLPLWAAEYICLRLIDCKLIAQYEPRLNAAVILHSPENPSLLLTTIPIDSHILSNIIEKPLINKTIAFIGPPQSGKSVFMYGLFKKLLAINYQKFSNSAFIIKACPDGEGLWSSEIDQNLVKILRYKNKFSDEFVEYAISAIKNMKNNKELIFVDIGGKIDDYTRRTIAECTHLILISSDEKKANEWREAFKGKKPFLADIKSVLSGTNSYLIEKIEGETFYMTISDLTRENQNVNIPEQFINKLINT